jgi:pyruvate dehydrogenase E1 component
MLKTKEERQNDLNPQETSEWLEALEQIVDEAGPGRAAYLLGKLLDHAAAAGVSVLSKINTPYLNTIPAHEEAPYPGNRALERRIKSIIRWNAAAMVVRANKHDPNIGGHVSTFASLAAISEVGFNHFFRGSYGNEAGDLVYYQGHASPGVYSRAFLEGRLTEDHLLNFRHELRDKPAFRLIRIPGSCRISGSSHRFDGHRPAQRHLPGALHALPREPRPHRKTDRKIWAFVGDGETDEVEPSAPSASPRAKSSIT